jgi:hypothetical protein
MIDILFCNPAAWADGQRTWGNLGAFTKSEQEGTRVRSFTDLNREVFSRAG